MEQTPKIAPWGSEFHWENVLPPSRPSLQQLQHLGLVIEHVPRDVPVAVMGSTPEYRDLLALHGFPDVTVIDLSPSFYHSMSLLRSTRSAEHFDESDWSAHFARTPGRYGLVLSDLTSGNIPYESRGVYYRNIRLALRRGGIFFDKILLHQRPLRSIRSLVQLFSRLPITAMTLNYFNCSALFTSEILGGGLLDTSRAYEQLRASSSNDHWRRFVSANESITPRDRVWYYGRRYRSLSDVYAGEFQIAGRVIDKSPIGYEGWASWLSLQRRD
jgi:hypothetical protein